MSIDELRDELAGLMGHRLMDQPVPLSLDWLAAHGLPDGCYLLRFGYAKRFNVWEAQISHGCVGPFDPVVSHGQSDTAVHSLLAACVAAWKAQHERSGT